MFGTSLSAFANLGKTLDKDAVTNLAVRLAKDVLTRLLRSMASNATSNVLYKFGKKTGKGDVNVGSK